MAKYTLTRVTKPEQDFMEKFLHNLRSDDRRELLAVAGDTRKEIEDSINYSAECWQASTLDGEPIVLFGRRMVPEQDGALIWCLGTDLLPDYWMAFLRESRRLLRSWAQDYGRLFNYVGYFNTISMRWLSWCGAKFHEEYNINGETFIRFTLESEDI